MYQISDYGRVKSLKRFGKRRTYIMKVAHNRKGYQCIGLTKGCKRQSFRIHTLVLSTFVSTKPSSEMEIDHINAVRDDNRVENLHWVTRTENARNPISYERARQSRIGKRRPQWIKDKLSAGKLGAKNPMYGRCGELSHRSRKVAQMDADGNVLKIWVSIAAAKSVGGNHISGCCRGKRNMAGGYKWKYA